MALRYPAELMYWAVTSFLFSTFKDNRFFFSISVSHSLIERLRNEGQDKTKTQMTQSFNQYSEKETKIWRQNIPNRFNRVSSSCLHSHFVMSLISNDDHHDDKEIEID